MLWIQVYSEQLDSSVTICWNEGDQLSLYDSRVDDLSEDCITSIIASGLEKDLILKHCKGIPRTNLWSIRWREPFARFIYDFVKQYIADFPPVGDNQ